MGTNAKIVIALGVGMIVGAGLSGIFFARHDPLSQFEKELRTETEKRASRQAGVNLRVQKENEENVEMLRGQPASVKKITANKTNWTIELDFLSPNPEFMPGADGVAGSYFINQSLKIRTFTIDKNTKTYQCGDGPDGEGTTADVSVGTTVFVDYITKRLVDYATYYFDTEANVVTAIREQCLP